MRMKILFGLFSCIALVFSLCFSPSANASSVEDEVLQVAKNYVKAMNESNFELMSSLFFRSTKFSYWGPNKFEAFLYQDLESFEKYLESIFELPKGTFNISLHHPQVTILDDNVSVITDYHTAIVNPPAVKEQITIQIRQTLVVQKINGKWLIVHEHESILPVE